MKKRVLLWVVFLLLLTSCSEVPENESSYSKNIYSLVEFRASPLYTKKVDGVCIKESDLMLLETNDINDDEYDKRSTIFLKKSLDNIIEIVDDENFRKEYNLSELSIFVYNENRIFMLFYQQDRGGFSCQKEFFIVDEKRVRMRSLGVIYGSFALDEESFTILKKELDLVERYGVDTSFFNKLKKENMR